MIAYDCDGLLTLREAAKEFPKRPHVSTLYRWALSPQGPRLETILVGGTRYTSKWAIQEFIEARTAADNQRRGLAPETPAARERAIASAEAALANI